MAATAVAANTSRGSVEAGGGGTGPTRGGRPEQEHTVRSQGGRGGSVSA